MSVTVTVAVAAGTRLTVAIDDKGGAGFSICSPSTPERFLQYELEMEAAFGRLVTAFVPQAARVERVGVAAAAREVETGVLRFSEDMEEDFDKPLILRSALEIFYYW